MRSLPFLQEPFPFASQTLVTKCDRAMQLVLAAQRQKIIDAPAVTLTDFIEEQGGSQKLNVLNPVRFYVIAKQLWLLGYLKDKPRKNISPKIQESPAFQQNVRRFQRDAGVTEDGWLGEQGWKTLQELVSFETPISPAKWQRPNGAFLMAFNRAVQLRMWAYGLVENKPSYTFTGLRQKQIAAAKRALSYVTGHADTTDDWLTVLFDSDLMLEHAIEIMRKPRKETRQQTEILRRVLISIARVELWLLGFAIEINNADNYRVEGFSINKTRKYRAGRTILTPVRSVQLNNSLTDFWHTLVGLPTKQAKKKALQLSLEFYTALRSPNIVSAAESQVNEVDFSKQAAKKLHTTEAINIAYARVKRLGMKLWDGVKRLWRWFINGVTKIAQVADNLARGFFRFAAKSYDIVRKALLALSASLKQYVQGRIENSGKSLLIVKKDFDFVLAVHPQDSPTMAVSAMNAFSTQFLFSSKIITLFIDALTSAISGVVGWARFLLTLVRNYRELVPLYRDLQATYLSKQRVGSSLP